MDRDLIRLQIVPEFSAIDGANTVNGIPGTTVKRVQTTVELREGQTLALGGLISRQTTTTINRIPFLGDIPFVGSRLFQSKNATEDEVELLVLVTPEIARPMEPDEVPPLPNYYITHPNDHDLYKYGRSEGSPDTTVYQTQPFGTGMTQGNPAGYSLQDASVLPQFTMPQKPVFVPEPIELPSSQVCCCNRIRKCHQLRVTVCQRPRNSNRFRCLFQPRCCHPLRHHLSYLCRSR
jgi:pilus assembly protein CpaC